MLVLVCACFADKNHVYERLFQYHYLVLATRNVDEQVPLFVQRQDEPDEVRRATLFEIMTE